MRKRSIRSLLAPGLLAALALAAAWPAAARGEPDGVYGSTLLSGATATAVFATGSGLDQVIAVADAAGDRLRFVELVSLEEIGTPFDLAAGCAPEDLLAVAGRLYVACAGADAVDILDLSAFSLASPTLTRLATVAVGSSPDRLKQFESGGTSLLVVQNAGEASASVISLSSMNAPIGINADDSSEVADTMSAPVPVRVCGDDPLAANRATPVGLGIGGGEFLIACAEGTLGHFDPFAGGDFSDAAEVDLGLPDLAAAAGSAARHGFFLQLTDGQWAVADPTALSMGGSIVLQPLADPGAIEFLVSGPADPRGLALFDEAATGNAWLALWGATAGELHLFDVSDLGEPGYVPPASRVADRILALGTGVFATGGAPTRGFFFAGNLFIPGGNEALTAATSAPLFTFTTTQTTAVSALTDPGLGDCAPVLPVQLAWTSSKAIDTASFEAFLGNSVVSAEPLGVPILNATDGAVEIDASDLAFVAGLSEQMSVRIAAPDAAAASAVGVALEPVILDSTRPEDVTGLSARIIGTTLFAEWTPATDPGTALASGVVEYVVNITRDPGLGTERVITTTTQVAELDSTIEAIDGSEMPLSEDEQLLVSVAVCDRAGNRSVAFSASATATGVRLGGTGALGETGGCGLGKGSNRGLGLLLGVALACLVIGSVWRKRGSDR